VQTSLRWNRFVTSRQKVAAMAARTSRVAEANELKFTFHNREGSFGARLSGSVAGSVGLGRLRCAQARDASVVGHP